MFLVDRYTFHGIGKAVTWLNKGINYERTLIIADVMKNQETK